MKDRDIVRDMLKRNNLSQTWLMVQLEQAGVEVDKSTMCAVLKGSRTGPKCQMILQKSLEVLQDYECRMASTELRSQFNPGAIGELSTMCRWLMSALVEMLRNPETRAILEQAVQKHEKES